MSKQWKMLKGKGLVDVLCAIQGHQILTMAGDLDNISKEHPSKTPIAQVMGVLAFTVIKVDLRGV